MRRLRGKLTYANVISTLCLFLLLGGGAAFAASHLGKNSVGSKQLKKNSVTGAKVKDNSLTGKDVNESTLGKVPSAVRADSAGTAARASSADTLGGLPPNAFVQSSRLINGFASTSVKSPQVVLTVPGEFRVLTTGSGGIVLFPEYENLSSHAWRFIRPESSFVTVLPGKKAGQEIPSTATILVFAQDTAEPSKYVFLQFGLNRVEEVLACQASLSPAA
jgi:hypothetical protein